MYIICSIAISSMNTANGLTSATTTVNSRLVTLVACEEELPLPAAVSVVSGALVAEIRMKKSSSTVLIHSTAICFITMVFPLKVTLVEVQFAPQPLNQLLER